VARSRSRRFADVAEKGLRRALAHADRNRSTEDIHLAAYEVWKAGRVPELRRAEVYDTASPVWKLTGSGSSKEGPNVEILHAGRPIEIVKGSALAKGEAEKPTLTHVANVGLSPIKIFEVVECKVDEATKVAPIDGTE